MSLYEDLTEILTPYADKINQNTASLDDLRDDFDNLDVSTDTTLTQSGMAADAKKTGDEISQIKADLDAKVDLTGENQVTPQNIEGMQFTKTTTELEGENIFEPSAMIYAEGKYVYVNNGVIDHVTMSDFNAYVIPVEQNAKYVFPKARFAALGKGNERYSEAVGTTINYATQANTGEATYLFLSYYSTTSASSITVKKVTEVNTYSDFILPDWMQQTDKVDKDGIGQVTTKNIEGMTLDGTRVSANLFPTATLVAHDKYVGGINSDTGKVSLYTNTGMDTYIIPVDGKSTYTFTYARTACVVADLDYNTPVGGILSNVRQIDSLGGSYILFSFTPASYPVSTYMITKPVTYYEIPSNWIIPQEGGNKTPTDKSSGAIASDGTMTIVGRSALKDGQMIAFKGKFASFSGFTLNFFGTAATNYIAVTGTTIAIKNTTTTPTPVNHNLTIENEVSLTVEFVEGNAKISLYSMGDVYTQTVSWNQTGGTVTQPQIKSDGTAFSEANLVTSYDCAIRDIWYFGDSYTGSSSPDRWCYYLKENGYMGNLLINGSAGATSGGAMISFNALINYGTPKIAVFATGMNDGSDSSAPPNNYVNRRTEFISLCESNGIEPVFCTIPTVPSVNNEQKNAWVRSSGYRYIDFASAVGADGTGAWYSGMLSGDNVHPSATGAKALYTQVLVDLPEITVS